MTDAPTGPRVLGTATDYGTLIGLLRARADELAVSRQCLDHVSGLQDGYSAKLLSAIPKKALGRTSLCLLLSALAVKLAVVEDSDQLAAISGRLEKRDEKSIHTPPPRLSGLPPDTLKCLLEQARAEVRPQVRAELIAAARRRRRRNGRAGANGHRANGHGR
jgi:hypothetical protein